VCSCSYQPPRWQKPFGLEQEKEAEDITVNPERLKTELISLVSGETGKIPELSKIAEYLPKSKVLSLEYMLQSGIVEEDPALTKRFFELKEKLEEWE